MQLPLTVLVAALGLGACGTIMSETRPRTPMVAMQPDLQVRIERVDVNRDLRYRDFSRDGRIVAQLDLLATHDTTVDLRRARMAIGGGRPGEQPRLALASGTGEPPSLLRDNRQLQPFALRAGEAKRVWVAFGQFEPRDAREIPERVTVQLPAGTPMALSDPGHTAPWRGKPVTSAIGMGLWMQSAADDTTMNVLVGDIRAAVGPLVLGTRYGIGVRDPQFRSSHGQTLVATNLPLAVDLAWPLVQTRDVIVAPYVGAEAALLLGDDNVQRRNWLGPTLGVQIALRPLSPQHGPFPIDYPRSALGAENIQLSLVHWFGPGREPPNFGVTLSFSLGWGS